MSDGYDDLDRDYEERETKQKAMVLSIVLAIQDLVTGKMPEVQRIARCDEITEAVIAFAFKGRLEPLQPRTETTQLVVALSLNDAHIVGEDDDLPF